MIDATGGFGTVLWPAGIILTSQPLFYRGRIPVTNFNIVFRGRGREASIIKLANNAAIGTGTSKVRAVVAGYYLGVESPLTPYTSLTTNSFDMFDMTLDYNGANQTVNSVVTGLILDNRGQHSLIQNCGFKNVLVPNFNRATPSYGIGLNNYDSRFAQVIGCVFENCDEGIWQTTYAQGNPLDMKAVDNHTYNSTDAGIYYEQGLGNVVWGNTVDTAVYGVECIVLSTLYDSRAVIAGNSFTGIFTSKVHMNASRNGVQVYGNSPSDSDWLGIGTSSPGAQLNIVSSGNNLQLRFGLGGNSWELNRDNISSGRFLIKENGGHAGEVFSILNTGQVGLGGVTAPTAFAHPAAATTAIASLRIPSGVRPTSPNDGDHYQDGTHEYAYIAGAWRQIDQQNGVVTSVAGRTGAVTLAESDVTGLVSDLSAKSPLASPTFTGTVTTGQLNAKKVGVLLSSANAINIQRTTTSTDAQAILFANGVAVDTYIGRLANSDDLVFGTDGGGGFSEKMRLTTGGVLSATTFSGSGASLTSIPESSVTNLVTDLYLKAPLASPTFTGTVTLPSGQALVAPALGTPVSGVATNLTGTASGLTAGAATVLATPRAIYGNNFDGSAALAQVIASTYGGTGNGFAKLSGPASTEKTFTLPNASATILTDNAAVTPAQGGSGQTTFTNGQLLIGNSSGNTLTKATITAGDGISITNGNGSITIADSSGYTLQGSSGTAGFNPANATTYYVGSRVGNTTSADGRSRIYIPRAGILKAVYLFFVNTTANSTSETSSAWVRLNSTTDTLISSAITNSVSGGSGFNNSGLGIAVAVGDFIEVKWTTPTWVTGPQATNISFVAYITPTG